MCTALAAPRSTKQDATIQLPDQKAELEKKRNKLEELRKAREVKKKETSFKEVKRLLTGIDK